MDQIINIDTIKDNLTKEEILKSNFGLEKEGLRVDCNAELILTPHPTIFGKKDENIYITTDFSESQLELITPTFDSIDKAHDFLTLLVNITNSYIKECEFIWNSSLPCKLPDSSQIPIAYYQFDTEARKYRQKLAKKYGTKKQLISGIHFNFSFDTSTLKKLYKNTKHEISYKDFQNQVYLKIVRNYIKYTWFIIYITGCSVALHKSFIRDCFKLANKVGDDGCYYATNSVSLRNSKCGYKNNDRLYPDYHSVDTFIESVNRFIEKGYISEVKELYTQIRLKTIDKTDVLKSLREDGIEYLEIRSIDINPFDNTGINKDDLRFIHLFIIYLLQLDESNYANWQEESLINEELTAHKGLNSSLKLLKDGDNITIESWSKQIIEDIKKVNRKLELGFEDVIEVIQERVNNPEKLYAKRLLKHYQNENFIDTSMNMVKQKKKDSIKQLDETIDKKVIDKIINNKQL